MSHSAECSRAILGGGMIDWGSIYRGLALAAVIVLFAVGLYFTVKTKRGQDALSELLLRILDAEVDKQTGQPEQTGEPTKRDV
jgi:hypothetical protein